MKGAFMYETEIWQQSVAKSLINTEAAITALAYLLSEKGIVTPEEFAECKDNVVQREPYASAIKQADENIAMYEKWKNADFGDILGGLFGKAKNE